MGMRGGIRLEVEEGSVHWPGGRLRDELVQAETQSPELGGRYFLQRSPQPELDGRRAATDEPPANGCQRQPYPPPVLGVRRPANGAPLLEAVHDPGDRRRMGKEPLRERIQGERGRAVEHG